MSSLDRSALARRAIFDAMRVSNLFDRRWGAITQGAEITSAQWLTLGLLEREGGEDGLTPTELCRRLCVSKQNMTGMILRLEKKGLIERRPDPHDRRSFRVQATGMGSKAVRTLAPYEGEFFLRQVDGLSDDTLHEMTEGLSRVLAHLKTEEKRAKQAQAASGS
jgi:DNA-binding MarR family transcriptional regulator